MKLTKNLGMLLLGIWLIATGVLQVVSIQIPAIVTILALLAIAAGVLILLDRQAVRFQPLPLQGASALHGPTIFVSLRKRTMQSSFSARSNRYVLDNGTAVETAWLQRVKITRCSHAGGLRRVSLATRGCPRF